MHIETHVKKVNPVNVFLNSGNRYELRKRILKLKYKDKHLKYISKPMQWNKCKKRNIEDTYLKIYLGLNKMGEMFNQISLKFFLVSDGQSVSIGSVYGMASNWWQAITWTNDAQFTDIYASVIPNDGGLETFIIWIFFNMLTH